MKFQELEAEICMLEEKSDLCENICEYVSMDEPVLLELQNLTQQVTNLDSYGIGKLLVKESDNFHYYVELLVGGRHQNLLSRFSIPPSRELEISD